MSLLNDYDFKPLIITPPGAAIIEELLIPAYTSSIKYDRAAGFFRSTIYSLCWESILKFIGNDGKIRLICCHEVTKDDSEEIISSYDRRTESLNSDIQADIEELIQSNDHRAKYTSFLGYLIANNYMDIRISVPTKENKERTKYGSLSKYHPKFGIFSDGKNRLAFNGSSNETLLGVDANREIVRVDRSWKSSEQDETIAGYEDNFEEQWKLGKDKDGLFETFLFPEAAKSNLLKYSSSKKEFEDEIAEIENTYKQKKVQISDRVQLWEIPGKRGLEVWKDNNYKSVLKYCTGSGKTRIAIAAIQIMLEANKSPIVLLPTEALMTQWEKELRNFPNVVDDKVILKCSSKNNGYKKKLFDLSRKDNAGNVIFLALIDSVITDFFKENFNAGEHNFLVADECHKLWASAYNGILKYAWGECPRLGLSATPEERIDIFDSDDILDESEGIDDDEPSSQRVDVLEFFGGKKSEGRYIPTDIFTLKDAIKYGRLKPYEYHIKIANLNVEELDHYLDLSRRIGRLSNTKPRTKEQQNKLQRSMFLRRQIINGAEDKRRVCMNILTSSETSGNKIDLHEQHWAVYVGVKGKNEKEIDVMAESIHQFKIKKNHNFHIHPFHSGKDEVWLKGALEAYEQLRGVLLAYKMFDEGIDIPVLSRGIMMASSRNQREFIQRRGRMLRRNPYHPKNEYEKAVIFDILIVPPGEEELENPRDIEYFHSHLAQECERARIFADDALNKHVVNNRINELLIEYGLEITNDSNDQ